MRIVHRLIRCLLLLTLGTCVRPALAQSSGAPSAEVKPSLPATWIETLQWRSIGPANMSGRITALAVYEKDSSIWWAASASGGLLKTTNNGITFEHQFDREGTVSIGDVQVSQADPNVVWVGTGEANPRNSASWGDGVYKSTDGGKTWTNMGLKQSFQIGRIALHPTSPDIIYVGAVGRLWGKNEERGLFKTVDGGKTWEKILYVDDQTGVIDVQMHPQDPETLLVATYERQRDGFDGNDPEKKIGPGSAIYKTTDGGKTFKKLATGLPTAKLGRIGLSYYRADPNQVYAVIETERVGKEPDTAPIVGLRGEDSETGARVTEVVADGPAAQAGLKTGDIILSLDGVAVLSYNDLLVAIRRRSAGDKVKLVVARERKSVDLELTLGKRPVSDQEEREDEAESTEQQQQRQARSPFDGGLGGQVENVQDQQGAEGFQFGGVYQSTDGGESWQRINSVNPRPMYYSQIRIDPSNNQHQWVLGTSLYRSADGGKTYAGDGAGGGVHPDHHAMWIDPKDGRHVILGNDGGIYVTWDRGANWDHHNHVAIGQFYHVAVDTRRNYRVYGGLQDNGSWGGPSRATDGQGPINTDWFRVGGGDGFVCAVDPEDPDLIYFESQNGAMGRINLRTGDRGSVRPPMQRGVRYRFNWQTPFVLSSHNSKIHYSAGNYVFRSLYKGNALKVISPEITLTDKGSGSALAESPRDADVLYAGTTDGGLWITRNGGQEWTNLYGKPPAEKKAEGAQPAEAKKQDESLWLEESGDDDDNPSAPAQDSNPQEPPADATQPPRRGPEQFLQSLMERDANQDGKLQKDELPERMQGFFDRLDSNQDGALDEEELKAMRGRMGRRRPEGDQPVGDATATPAPLPQPPDKPQDAPPTTPATPAPMPQPVEKPQEAPAAAAAQAAPADKLSGTWQGKFLADNLPAERSQFTLVLKLAADGKVTGNFESAMSQGELEGTYDAQANKLSVAADTERATIEFTGAVEGNKMSGQLDINSGAFSLDFEAERTVAPEAAAQEPAAPATAPTEAAAAPAAPSGTSLQDLLPGPRWVSAIEASRFETGRAYVTFDGHRSNDDEPYVFVTEDFGKTWRSLRANLPAGVGSTRAIREDLFNANVLYLGTEFACWVSIDRGQSWTKLNSNLPTVAVHDFAQHRTAGEMVAATHGRSLWVLDVSPLRQMTADTIKADAKLYKPSTAIKWLSTPGRGASGTRRFVGQNPPSGAQIYYSLGKDAGEVRLKITDVTGRVLFEPAESARQAGLHLVNWDLRGAVRRQPPAGSAGPGRGGFGGPGGAGGPGRGGFGGAGGPGRGPAGGQGRFFGGRGAQVPAGRYLVTLTVDEREYKEELLVEDDPDAPNGDAAVAAEEEVEESAAGIDD